MDLETHVMVALSGGVDSALVLQKLSQSYKHIHGVSHRHWPESKCCTTACIDGCRSQCQDLGVPFQTIDTLTLFVEKVVEPFVESYNQGLTPNPCVSCNEINRFGAMAQNAWEKMGKPEKWKIATGHYAQIHNENGRYYLHRGLDPKKDQSYMLYRLSQEQLSHCLFPLGSTLKEEVRQEAQSYNLASAKKSDSQDICFVENNYQEFLKDYTGKTPEPGVFLDSSGKKLGYHKGVPYYNRGQRKGLGLSGGPWYVIKIIPENNEIILGPKEELLRDFFSIQNLVFNEDVSNLPEETTVQVRYHGEIINCEVVPESKERLKIKLEQDTVDLSPGQSAVIYHKNRVLGGGVIINDF